MFFTGTKIEPSPLDEDQQLLIAQALRGEDGAELLDRAWRTPHVRDLVAIPLYLNKLMRLPPGSPFPETREAVLRSFVDAHGAKPDHLAKLHALLGPFQRDYLEGLALAAGAATTSSLDDAAARRAIAATATALFNDGQIARVQTSPLRSRCWSTIMCRRDLATFANRLCARDRRPEKLTISAAEGKGPGILTLSNSRLLK